MVVAAVPASVTKHRPHKFAATSTCCLPSVQWRVGTWCVAAIMLLILQGCSGVLKAADEQTPAILGEAPARSEEHTSELQSHVNLVCRLLLEKKNRTIL